MQTAIVSSQASFDGDVRGDGCLHRSPVGSPSTRYKSPSWRSRVAPGELPECTLLTCQRPRPSRPAPLAVLPADLPQGSPGDVPEGRGAPSAPCLDKHRLGMRGRSYLLGFRRVEHRGHNQGRTPVVPRTVHAARAKPAACRSPPLIHRVASVRARERPGERRRPPCTAAASPCTSHPRRVIAVASSPRPEPFVPRAR